MVTTLGSNLTAAAVALPAAADDDALMRVTHGGAAGTRFFPQVDYDDDDTTSPAPPWSTGLNGSVGEPGNAALLKFINYVAYDIIANVIVFIGLISNVLNLIVLTRPKLKGLSFRQRTSIEQDNTRPGILGKCSLKNSYQK